MAVVPSIEPPAPAALSPIGGSAAPAQQSIDLPAGPLQQPSASQAQDFARAAATPLDVQAAQPSAGGGLMERIARQADAFSQKFQLPHIAPAPAQDHGQATALAGRADDVAAAAVTQMEHAYMIAIETTMASRGSTESTKIFNTLLKGQ